MSTPTSETKSREGAAPGPTGSGLVIVSTIVGIAVSAVLVWLAFRRVDLGTVQRSIGTLIWWPWVPLAVSAYLVGHLVRGWRCAMLLRGQASLGPIAATNIVIAGYASNNVLPARMGELVRVGLLTSRTGLPLWQSLSVTALERVIDGIAILTLLTISTINATPSAWLTALAQLAALVLGGAGAVLLVAVLWPALPVTIASRIGARLSHKMHDRLVRMAGQLVAGVRPLRSPGTATSFLLSSLIVWSFEALMFVALLPAFGLEPSFWRGALAMGVTNLGLLAPSTPGFVGTFHSFCAAALETQGVDPSLAMSFAVVAHLTFFIPVTLWGAAVLLASGVKLGATISAVRSARSGGEVRVINGIEVHVISSHAAHVTKRVASPFIKSLIESLVSRSTRTEDIDQRALLSAAQFTVDQLGALSSLLQFAFACGMLMFRTWVLLRYFSRFEKLSLEKRRLAAESWAYGRIGLFRMLFRPVRGVAILSYYERQGAKS
ncbi:MAG: lysylphosphatidylglycerol synthase transmembrane domain-containing protein [Archangium sp.]